MTARERRTRITAGILCGVVVGMGGLSLASSELYRMFCQATGYGGTPKTEDVAHFLELLRASPDKKVFVHCERGAERTGVMVACYRISSERWTADQATAWWQVNGK